MSCAWQPLGHVSDAVRTPCPVAWISGGCQLNQQWCERGSAPFPCLVFGSIFIYFAHVAMILIGKQYHALPSAVMYVLYGRSWGLL